MKTVEENILEGGERIRGRAKESFPNRPLVSIITVVRNGESHLEEAIRSVLGQSYKNVEYLVVDGGSTDGSLEIIRRYDDRIDYWISEPDAGIYDAMNKGIALAGGDLIGILNSDDYFLPDAVGRVVEAALAHPEAEVFHGNMTLLRANGIKELRRPRLCRENYRPYLMPVNHPTVFARSLCYTECGTFNTVYRTAADFDLMLRFLYDYRFGFHYLDANLACMREGGKSGQYSIETYRDIIDILQKRGLSGWLLFRFRAWYLRLMLLCWARRFGVYRAAAGLYCRLKHPEN